MFTGIVEELGELVNRQHASGTGTSLVIKASRVMDDLDIGDSIAVNGVCLTVARRSSNTFYADVMPETLRKTNLHQLNPGDLVNLERALSVGGRLGGHFLSGHVDSVGKIIAERNEGNALVKTIRAPEEVMRYIIKKGSIAVDGISLTVVDLGDNWFTVSLIPHTAGVTTFRYKHKGDTVNLEADMLVKYVEKLLEGNNKGQMNDKGQRKSKISYEFLQEKGF